MAPMVARFVPSWGSPLGTVIRYAIGAAALVGLGAFLQARTDRLDGLLREAKERIAVTQLAADHFTPATVSKTPEEITPALKPEAKRAREAGATVAMSTNVKTEELEREVEFTWPPETPCAPGSTVKTAVFETVEVQGLVAFTPKGELFYKPAIFSTWRQGSKTDRRALETASVDVEYSHELKDAVRGYLYGHSEIGIEAGIRSDATFEVRGDFTGKKGHGIAIGYAWGAGGQTVDVAYRYRFTF